MLTPGQTSAVTAVFTGPAGTYAAPELRTTPMLNPTTVTVDSPAAILRSSRAAIRRTDRLIDSTHAGQQGSH